MTWTITRSASKCVRCGQPLGAKHLVTCPITRFTAGAGAKGTVA